jgi:hypothetical protein
VLFASVSVSVSVPLDVCQEAYETVDIHEMGTLENKGIAHFFRK